MTNLSLMSLRVYTDLMSLMQHQSSGQHDIFTPICNNTCFFSSILGQWCYRWDKAKDGEEGKETPEARKEIARTWRKRWRWGKCCSLPGHACFDLRFDPDMWSCLSVQHARTAWLRTIGWSYTVDSITEVSQTLLPLVNPTYMMSLLLKVFCPKTKYETFDHVGM